MTQPSAIPMFPRAGMNAPSASGAMAVDSGSWVARCTQRLGELLPLASSAERALLAESLWADVGSFDPAIAAEMEAESIAG